MTYYINIGTNLGNRSENIAQAIDALSQAGMLITAKSATVTSDAMGFESNHQFLNMAIAIESLIAPLDMLTLLKQVEDSVGTSQHRDSEGRYIDRIIDLDIMAIDQSVISTPRLQVPHAHLAERYFFIKPFLDICPEWIHPVSGLSLQQMLNNLT